MKKSNVKTSAILKLLSFFLAMIMCLGSVTLLSFAVDNVDGARSQSEANQDASNAPDDADQDLSNALDGG